MNKNVITLLVFILIVIVLFWMMSNSKIETIESFVEKIIYPICFTFGGSSMVKNGVKVIKNRKQKP